MASPSGRGGSATAGPGRRKERGPLDPRAVLTSIGEVVYDWDIASDALAWSANAGDVLGLPDIGVFATGAAFGLACEETGGRTRHDAVLSGDAEDAGGGVPYRAAYALRLPPGARAPHADAQGLVLVEDTGRWYAGADGRPAFAHGVVRVGAMGLGLVGPARARSLFLDGFAAEAVASGRSKRPLTVMVMAVDGLARLNEEIGFDAADAAMEEAMRRAGTVMRRRDVFARYASNRFGVALLSCAPDQVEIAAARLRLAVESEPVETPRGPVTVRIALGAASAPQHATDAPGLLRRAEEALAESRRSACAFRMYRPGLGAPTSIRPVGERGLDIVAALNERRVVMARQPIVDAQSRKPAFAEALARIREEDGRIRSAGDIVPLIERAGLVPLLDVRMLELAAGHLATHPDDRLSINLSPVTLEAPDWLSTLAAVLGAHRGVAERLIVEVTETVAVRDPEATRARLDAMKALGVAVALDDFGAGHTSFRHLRDFPVDLLKIDGAFVQNLPRSPDDRFFVRTLIDLAHHLGIPTVAEWVEDEETAAMLASWGVEYLQGEHCGAPVLAEARTGKPDRRAAVA